MLSIIWQWNRKKRQSRLTFILLYKRLYNSLFCAICFVWCRKIFIAKKKFDVCFKVDFHVDLKINDANPLLYVFAVTRKGAPLFTVEKVRRFIVSQRNPRQLRVECSAASKTRLHVTLKVRNAHMTAIARLTFKFSTIVIERLVNVSEKSRGTGCAYSVRAELSPANICQRFTRHRVASSAERKPYVRRARRKIRHLRKSFCHSPRV